MIYKRSDCKPRLPKYKNRSAGTPFGFALFALTVFSLGLLSFGMVASTVWVLIKAMQ